MNSKMSESPLEDVSTGRKPYTLRSMTGYARATGASKAFDISVEIRAVNHRYLELHVRVPGGIAELEMQIRNKASQAMSRGKVDVSIHLKPKTESAYELEIDGPMLAELIEKGNRVVKEYGLGGEVSASDLIGFSPAFRVKDREFGSGAGLWKLLEPVLEEAINNIKGMRVAEGKEIHVDLNARIQTIADRVDQVEMLSQASRDVKRQKLQQKVEELIGRIEEPAAMVMEVTKFVERSDVTEELTRLRSHLMLWHKTVTTPGPCGKKLDFIIQEMNREVNTIGSKCQDATMTDNVITVKTELERIREQVQNIE